MFAIDCPTCGVRRLVLTKQITAIRNAGTGIQVHFTCSCGTRGVWITGRKAVTPGVLWDSPSLAAAS